ncbi:MAG: SAF domain-containing protein, partial [Planctomycetota bacterium]
MAAPSSDPSPSRLRPKSYTVFAAAFLAGAAAAVGVNRVLDVHLAQRRPQVECEPIFVALRPLPQGSPVTVWDVALKDWPKAMLPSTALRAGDSFEGFVLRHAIREGQPLLAVQLIRSESGADEASGGETFVPAVPASATTSPTAATTTGDLWTPAAMDTQSAAPVADLAAGADHVTADGPQEPTAETVTPDPLPVDQPSPPQPTAVIADAESEPAESEAAEQAPMVAAVEPTSPTADPPVAPSPATTVVTTPSQPTPADEITSAEMSEAVATDGATDVATDVATMPSVIKQSAVAATTPSQPPAGDAGRYLVVPERIALQADTSFTTPRPQPPGPPATARPSA